MSNVQTPGLCSICAAQLPPETICGRCTIQQLASGLEVPQLNKILCILRLFDWDGPYDDRITDILALLNDFEDPGAFLDRDFNNESPSSTKRTTAQQKRDLIDLLEQRTGPHAINGPHPNPTAVATTIPTRGALQINVEVTHSPVAEAWEVDGAMGLLILVGSGRVVTRVLGLTERNNLEHQTNLPAMGTSSTRAWHVNDAVASQSAGTAATVHVSFDSAAKLKMPKISGTPNMPDEKRADPATIQRRRDEAIALHDARIAEAIDRLVNYADDEDVDTALNFVGWVVRSKKAAHTRSVSAPMAQAPYLLEESASDI